MFKWFEGVSVPVRVLLLIAAVWVGLTVPAFGVYVLGGHWSIAADYRSPTRIFLVVSALLGVIVLAVVSVWYALFSSPDAADSSKHDRRSLFVASGVLFGALAIVVGLLSVVAPRIEVASENVGPAPVITLAPHDPVYKTPEECPPLVPGQNSMDPDVITSPACAVRVTP